MYFPKKIARFGQSFYNLTPMSLDIIRRSSEADGWIKSKKFFWNFREELAKTLAELEILLTLELWEIFSVNSIFLGNNDIKIRIRDESEWIDKIVGVIFRYHHEDEKYGNVHIEVVASELSKKTKTHFLWRFLITDRKNINKEVLQTLILGIRAIY